MSHQEEAQGHRQGGGGNDRQHGRSPDTARRNIRSQVRDQEYADGGQDDRPLLVDMDDMDRGFRGGGDIHAQNGPAGKHDDNEQRHVARKRAGKDDGGEGVTPQAIVYAVKDTQCNI